jgi:hypothetical protein
MNTKADREEALVFELLDAVGKQCNVSQRRQPARFHAVSLGVTDHVGEWQSIFEVRRAEAARLLH